MRALWLQTHQVETLRPGEIMQALKEGPVAYLPVSRLAGLDMPQRPGGR